MQPTAEFWIRGVTLEVRDGTKSMPDIISAAREMAGNGTKVTLVYGGYTYIIYDPEQF